MVERSDTRTDGPRTGGEREVFDHWLELYRETVLEDAGAATVSDDVRAYEDELAVTRAATAAWTDLDRPVRGLRRGEPVNLRWVLVHLVEEYARHLGHMDLLREAVDGRTGY